MLINKNWVFYKKGFEQNKIKVDLPYDAMLREERSIDSKAGDKVGFFLGGDYYYEKELSFTEDDLKDQIYYLRFEGVYHDPVISINDKEVYKHNYGYADFIFEITDHLVPGVNKITVFCTNSDQPNSRWYSGAGIYRDVHLLKYPKIHVIPRSFRILTKDYKTGSLQVDAKLTAKADVKLSVYDKENNVVYQENKEGDDLHFNFAINDAKLWSVDSPYLYRFELSYNGIKEEKKSGIRQIELSKEKGFLINGIRTPLLGGCIHSDNGLLGAETYPDVERRKIRILKEAGYNAIRSAHNPIVESFLDAADEEGFLVMDEYVDCWYIHKTQYDYSSHVEKNYKDDLRLMVEKDYSHPCVILYSTGNEVGETSFPRGIKFTKTLTDTLHELDASRPVTCGINVFFNGLAHTPFTVYSDKNAEEDIRKKELEKEKRQKEEQSNKKKKNKPSGSSDIYNAIANLVGQNFMKYGAKLRIVDKHTKGAFANMDVAGYNYGIKRYKKDLKKYPNRFILGSETFLADAGYFYDLYLKNPRVIGDFVWSGMDYLGEAGFNSWANGSDYDFANDPSGWITDGGGRININGDWLSEMDYQRVCFHKDIIAIGAVSPHDLECRAHPAAWKFSRALRSYSFDGYEGKDTEIEVYTYAPYFELYLNDKLLKRFKNKKNKNFAKFKMKYVPGTLKAIAYDKDHKVLGQALLSSGKKETKLHLIPEKETYKQDEIVFVHARFQDEEGNIKPLHNDYIEITSIENATFLRFGTAARYNKSSYFDKKIKTYYGRALLILKPESSKPIKVTIKTSTGEEVSTAININ